MYPLTKRVHFLCKYFELCIDMVYNGNKYVSYKLDYILRWEVANI